MRAKYKAYADYICDVAAFKDFGAINAAAAANGSYTQAMFIGQAVFNRSDGVPIDYVHYGNY